MAQTINLPGLISRISSSTGASPADVRRFLHELFASVESSIEAGESVVINGLGEFVKGDSFTSPVLFRADAAFAARLNEPFAAFEAVELNDGAEQEFGASEFTNAEADVEYGRAESDPQPPSQPYIVLEEVTEEVNVTPLPESEKETEPAAAPAPAQEQPKKPEAVVEPIQAAPKQPVEVKVEPVEAPEPIRNTQPVTPEVSVASTEKPVDDGNIVNESYQPATNAQNKVLWLILGILIGLLIGVCAGYFAGKVMGSVSIPEDFEYSYVEEDEATETPESSAVEQTAPQPEVTETIAPVDNSADTPAQPAATESAKPADAAPAAKQPVYDTVTQSRYLALIAKEHYGVKNYWIFIYEANPGLGNPNKIAPGTRVLVPDISTFAEESTKATTAKASRKIGELQKKYKI